jgi:hypothetical protein
VWVYAGDKPDSWVYAGDKPAAYHPGDSPAPERQRITCSAVLDVPTIDMEGSLSVSTVAEKVLSRLHALDMERLAPVSQKRQDDELLVILAA